MCYNWKRHTLSVTTTILFFASAALALAATPKEAVGFWGKVSGTVKSAQADGLSFVFTVSKAEADATNNTAKDPAAMVGKDLTLGTRMTKKDGKNPTPNDADVAFIKTLKPGMTADLEIFAVKADPTVLRIKKPGQITGPTSEPAPK